jgi:hypothetical protein
MLETWGRQVDQSWSEQVDESEAEYSNENCRLKRKTVYEEITNRCNNLFLYGVTLVQRNLIA